MQLQILCSLIMSYFSEKGKNKLFINKFFPLLLDKDIKILNCKLPKQWYKKPAELPQTEEQFSQVSFFESKILCINNEHCYRHINQCRKLRTLRVLPTSNDLSGLEQNALMCTCRNLWHNYSVTKQLLLQQIAEEQQLL